MINLVVGAPRERSDLDISSEIEYARALLNDNRFERLMTDTADRLVREWSNATDSIAREAAWHKLQGLKTLLRELQATLDQGLSRR